MTFNTTESRIPGGFTKANADKLGYATEVIDHLCMVSFLPQSLHFGAGMGTLFNNYVVFTDGTHFNAQTNFQYAWTIEYLNSQNVVINTYQENRADYLTGQYPYSLHDQGLRLHDLPDLKTLRVTCTVSAGNATTDLVLSHQIEPAYPDIEDLFTEDEDGHLNAVAGNPAITHYVSNIYREFFPPPATITWEGAALDIPMNLPVSILYSRLLRFHFDITPNVVYEQGLNDDDLAWSDRYQDHQVGLCAVKPYLAAMVLGKIPFQRLNDTLQEEDLFNTYLTLTAAGVDQLNRTDIFNYARFPKSNIALTGFMLSELKRQAQENDCLHFKGTDADRNTWKNLPKEGIAYEKNFIRNLLTEYFTGPQQSINNFSYRSMGRPPKHDWASYLVNILEQSYVNIPFELVKIKVLDIRSGKAIKRAKVKKLKILYVQQSDTGLDPGFYETTFAYTHELLEAGSLLTKAKRVLIRWSYLVENENNIDETWTQNHSDAVNGFLAARKLTDIVSLEAGLNQDSVISNYTFVLQYIVAEYNRHGYTDDEGVLNVNIPEAILDRSYVHLEVGFHDFPITPEGIAASNAGNPGHQTPITRNHPVEVATNFKVKWIGNDTNNQQTGWQPTIDSITENLDNYWDNTNTVHFGWRVTNDFTNSSSYLTVCTKLVIKNDNYLPFERLSSSVLSLFYDEIVSPYHFILFGMQWCQPVWIESNNLFRIRGLVNTQNTTEQVPSRNNIAICTRWDAPANRSGQGRDYGTLILNPVANSPRGTRPHHGVDYHGIDGVTPVFCPHGGVVHDIRSTNNDPGLGHVGNSGGYGVTVIIEIPASDHFIRLAHLSENTPITLNNSNGQKEQVMAGRQIGFAGLTFNLNGFAVAADTAAAGGYYDRYGGPTHLHLEICRDSIVNRLADPKSIITEMDSDHNVPANKEVFLNNDSHRLFPCDCHGNRLRPLQAINCEIRGGGDTDVSTTCWAARNLHCPYLAENAQVNFTYQAQLKYLFKRRNDLGQNYLDPGTADGTWHNNAQNAIRRFRQLHADLIYPDPPGLPTDNNVLIAEPAGNTLIVLNDLAPYPRTPASFNIDDK